MKKIQSLGYQVEIGPIAKSSFNELLTIKYQNSKKVIIVDENSHDNCLEYLITTFEELKEAEVMMLPAGEENKVLEVCFQVWEALSDYEVSRNDLIINLGGGVVTDMGGFIASVYKRGVDFINIPTTLLSMVDASVGGKTGIDLGPYKNQLGTFTQPKGVFIDLGFTETLDDDLLMSGFAEMLKHGLALDKIYWQDLNQVDSNEALLNEELIYRSVALKNEIVKTDENEKGARKLLNFGHTIGHAIEGYSLMNSPISHGHAVGIGMLAESYISYRLGWLNEEEWSEVSTYLPKLYPMIDLKVEEFDQIIDLMKNDKKNDQGEIRSCLLKGIGSGVYDEVLSIAQIYDALAYLVGTVSE
jgi:3-dehydroquinate synthase